MEVPYQCVHSNGSVVLDVGLGRLCPIAGEFGNEIPVLEIWTNGSGRPEKVLYGWALPISHALNQHITMPIYNALNNEIDGYVKAYATIDVSEDVVESTVRKELDIYCESKTSVALLDPAANNECLKKMKKLRRKRDKVANLIFQKTV